MHNAFAPPEITDFVNVCLSRTSSPKGPIQALKSTVSFQED